MNKLYLFAVLVALFVAVSSATSAFGNDTVVTPFGIRPAACHNKVPSGTKVVRTDAGYDLILPNGKGIESRVSKQECLDYEAEFAAARQARTEAVIKARTDKTPKVAGPQDTVGDGWLDNSGYWPSQLVKSVTGFYLIPDNPQTDNGQVLFYFLGTENNSDGLGVTILQPVLTWNNGNSQWSMASWNCCPSGETFESDSITGLSAGQTMYGEILDNGDGSWTIGSAFNDGSNAVILTVDGYGRQFNWVDATLEVYSVTGCDGLSSSEMRYTDVYITRQDGYGENANWDSNSPTACNGRMNIYDSNTVGIQHN